MQLPDQPDDRDEALEAPPRLVAALKQLPKPAVFIPPATDQAILRAAERQLARPQAHAPRWFRFMPWIATATALVALVAVIPQLVRKPAAANVARDDVNRDGQVDILDALALARRLNTGAGASPQLDANGDGVVDERDVATVAARAVSLGKGRGS